jgi:hypothetical protein
MEKITYKGLKNCYRIANDHAQLIVTTQVGPRILAYSRPSGENLLGEFPELKETTEYGEWKPYGGHRLWVAPESKPLSYAPDNDPIEVRNIGDFGVHLVAPTDKGSIDKEMTVSLDPLSSKVEIRHKIINRGATVRDLAVWALTIFKGGEAYVPLEPFRSHDDALWPSQAMILWPFTELADPRIHLGNGWLNLKSEPIHPAPQKLGFANRQRWAAHYGSGELFIKRFNYCEGANYPDMGSNCEFYVAGEFMELESLSPISRLQPGESVEHVETWELRSATEDNLAATLASVR